jgi:hypothetical protein
MPTKKGRNLMKVEGWQDDTLGTTTVTITQIGTLFFVATSGEPYSVMQSMIRTR